MTRRARAAGIVGLVVSILTVVVPAHLDAQQPDSTRTKIFERLRQLARPPGLDSTLLVDDSVRQAQLQAERAAQSNSSSFDSIAAQLLALPGFAVTRYEAAGAEFGSTDRRLSLIGSENQRPVVRRDDFELSADTAIDFDEERGLVIARGEAQFSRPNSEPLSSQQLIYDLNADRGTALGARTIYNEGADWRVAGDLTSVQPGLFWGRHISFTSCELDEPHYHFATGEIKWLSEDWFVARNVTLKFADVPVLWLPFLAQGLGSGRSSGLLPPTFSINDIVRTSGSYQRRISGLGFYWAMSDYTDAQISMDWFSERFFSLQGGFNYFWAKQFLRGGVNYREFWEADGSSQRTLNTRNSWEINERTSLAVDASYASSGDFIRRESRNPLEVIQSIDSNARFTRRFDWGTTNIGASRKQFLSNDRVEMTLPSVSLSLTPLTFFKAPTGRERWYNNLSWSGGASLNRNVNDQPVLADTAVFSFGTADLINTRGNLNSSFTLGSFGFSQNVSLTEKITQGVPESVLTGDTLLPSSQVRDISEGLIDWSSTLDYQLGLIGSLTFTPRLRLSGQLLRSDTIPDAVSYVSGPRRSSFGAQLKFDLYGFGPGFGPFERIRHKFSPAFDYDYAPEVSPTEIQARVFGNSRVIAKRNQISVTLNNTWEAKLNEDAARQADSAQAAFDSIAVLDSIAADSLGIAPDSTSVLGPDGQPQAGVETLGVNPFDRGEPTRPASGSQPVQLLGLSLSAVQYDFVVADSTGRWEDGLQSTELQARVTSDYLRGLSLSSTVDLFDRSDPTGGTGTGVGERRFDMHLKAVNLGFSLNSNSTIFRWLGFFRGLGGGGDDGEVAAAPPPEDPLSEGSISNETNIVPTADPFRSPAARRGGRGFNASFTYSLQRPRDPALQRSELLTSNVSFSPTERWDVTWRTSYDREQGQFLDHIVRLTRDMHRWDANFDFIQTVTGNWTFRFEVSLRDNQDLKFDYEQRSLDRR